MIWLIRHGVLLNGVFFLFYQSNEFEITKELVTLTSLSGTTQLAKTYLKRYAIRSITQLLALSFERFVSVPPTRTV